MFGEHLIFSRLDLIRREPILTLLDEFLLCFILSGLDDSHVASTATA